MLGSSRVAMTLLFAALLVPAACGPSKQPPTVDPIKEQITVLQRQLLELQKVQLDTRKKVDEQAAVNDALSSKVTAMDKALEEHKAATPPPAAAIVKPTSSAQAAPVKKPAKWPVKKKKKKPAPQSPQ